MHTSTTMRFTKYTRSNMTTYTPCQLLYSLKTLTNDETAQPH